MRGTDIVETAMPYEAFFHLDFRSLVYDKDSKGSDGIVLNVTFSSRRVLALYLEVKAFGISWLIPPAMAYPREVVA